MLKNIFLLSLITLSSCALFNSKTAQLAINSNPSNARIMVDGRNYGYTPAVLNLEPIEHNIEIVKNGYINQKFTTPVWWLAVPTDVNGKTNANGNRCFLDAMSLIFMPIGLFTGDCADFKQKQYNINLTPNQNQYYNYQQ